MWLNNNFPVAGSQWKRNAETGHGGMEEGNSEGDRRGEQLECPRGIWTQITQPKMGDGHWDLLHGDRVWE